MIRFQSVSFTYPEAHQPAIQGIDLHIPRGEFVLLSGVSGSGKSTLLRCINGLVPYFSGGVIQGQIQVAGISPLEAGPKAMSQVVGFVFQDPETQFVYERVEDDIAFSLENSALPSVEMRRRVEWVLDLLQLREYRKRRLATLSGGERQRVAIAAGLVRHPQVMVFDEPTSQLDPQSSEQVLQTILQLHRELELTIVLSEHRLERVLPYVDRIVHLEMGQPGVISGPPQTVLKQIDHTPPLISLAKTLDWQPLPLSLDQARQFAREARTNSRRLPLPSTRNPSPGQALRSPHTPVMQICDLEVDIGKTNVLRSVSLEIYPGEILAIIGANGVGKTTLLRSLVGLQKPARGQITLDGKPIHGLNPATICQQIGYLPQDPNALLFSDSVRAEMLLTLKNHQLSQHQYPTDALLEELGILPLAEAYPRDLSVGERQRAALAAILVTLPKVILLDEPTRGLDYLCKQQLTRLFSGWREAGRAVVIVTHDVELVAQIADRVALMVDGAIKTQAQPAEVMQNHPEYASQVARLFPNTSWVTAQQALSELTLNYE